MNDFSYKFFSFVNLLPFCFLFKSKSKSKLFKIKIKKTPKIEYNFWFLIKNLINCNRFHLNIITLFSSYVIQNILVYLFT